MNDSKYGLQAGVFTNDINRAFEAHRDPRGRRRDRERRVARSAPTRCRTAARKDSGFGREGLRFAMEEMTEPRIMVLSHVPL